MTLIEHLLCVKHYLNVQVLTPPCYETGTFIPSILQIDTKAHRKQLARGHSNRKQWRHSVNLQSGTTLPAGAARATVQGRPTENGGGECLAVLAPRLTGHVILTEDTALEPQFLQP